MQFGPKQHQQDCFMLMELENYIFTLMICVTSVSPWCWVGVRCMDPAEDLQSSHAVQPARSYYYYDPKS